MKKVLIIIISIILGILFFSIFQYFFKSGSQKGALQITSSPASKVYLNDKYLGQTPLCKCEVKDMQKAGEYTLRLEPINKNFPNFDFKISLICLYVF